MEHGKSQWCALAIFEEETSMDTSVLLLAISLLWAGDETHVRVPASEFKEVLAKASEAKILDLRTPKEHAAGHLENCRLIDYFDKNFQKLLADLPKDETYFIYCRSGGRSGKTLKLMQEMGFSRVYEMSDGFLGWQKAGFPTIIPEKE